MARAYGPHLTTLLLLSDVLGTEGVERVKIIQPFRGHRVRLRIHYDGHRVDELTLAEARAWLAGRRPRVEREDHDVADRA